MMVQGRNYKTLFAIAIVVLLAVAALSGVFYLRSSNTRTTTITLTTAITATTAATTATVIATYSTTIIPSTNSIIHSYQNIIDLNDSEPIRLANGQFIQSFSFGYLQTVIMACTFRANDSGYIIVKYSSVTLPAEEGIQVTETPTNPSYGASLFLFSSSSGNATSGTQLYPVVPGSVSVYIRTTSSVGGASSATLSVTYYY
jgi:hypothetical protein